MEPDCQVELFNRILQEAVDASLDIKEKFRVKEKGASPSKYILQEVRKLLRRIIKLSMRILATTNWKTNLKVMEELGDVTSSLEAHYLAKRRTAESKAIEKMKSDPKYFYNYQRRFSSNPSGISDLVTKVDGVEMEASTDEEKAEALSVQYQEVWSVPKENYMVSNHFEFFHECIDCVEERVHDCFDDIMEKIMNENPEDAMNSNSCSPYRSVPTLAEIFLIDGDLLELLRRRWPLVLLDQTDCRSRLLRRQSLV